MGLVIVTPTLSSLKSFASDAVSGSTDPAPDDVTITYANQAVSTYGEHDGLDAVADGDVSTFCWFQGLCDDITVVDASVTVTYGTPKHAKEFRFVQAEPTGDVINNGIFEYQGTDGEWYKIGNITSDQTQKFTLDEAVDVKALRVTNLEEIEKWWQVYDISLVEVPAGPADTTELEAAITAAQAVTDDAKAAFDAAFAAAQEGLKDEGLTQPEADKLASALNEAAKGVERFTGMTLEELEASKASADAYTAGSYVAYESAYNALHKALENASNLSKADGEALVASLEAAKAALVPDQTARDEAQLALNDAAKYNEKDYSAESWKAFVDARDALAVALEQRTAADFDALRADLEAAIAGLKAPEPEPVVDKTGLQASVDAAGKLEAGDYTAESWAAFQEALEAARARAALAAAAEGLAETLTYTRFPREHWRRMRTNNAIERLNREIRRRTREVGTFPDGNSALMLVTARLKYVAESEWGSRRYLDVTLLEEAHREAGI